MAEAKIAIVFLSFSNYTEVKETSDIFFYNI